METCGFSPWKEREQRKLWKTWKIPLFSLCLILVMGPGIAGAADPIKIGHLQPRSGMMADYGKLNAEGVELAVEEINKAGGLLGRQVMVVYKDTKASPEAGLNEAMKLVLETKVDVLIGTSSSAVAKAVAPLASKHKVPFIITDAQTPDIIEKDCNKFTFRTSDDLVQINRGAGMAVLKHIGVPKRLACITADYIFGHQTWECFKKTILDSHPDVKIVDEIFPKFMETNYRTYITRLMNAKPDVVFSSFWAGELITFFKQAKGFGFSAAVPVFINTSGSQMDVSEALGEDMLPMWGVDRYYCEYPDIPMNRKFVEAYKAKFRYLPKATSGEGYGAALAFFEAVKKAGSVKPEEVAKALEGLTWATPEGTKYIRPEDHQAIQEHVLFGKIGPGKRLPYWAYETIYSVPGKDVIAPPSKECKMQ
jgi:branched-chain amino acid transport system substrate-binding protein